MSRGGWREFVYRGPPIARHKRMVLNQRTAIGAGVIGVGMRMLLVLLLLLMVVGMVGVVLVVRMRGTLTRD